MKKTAFLLIIFIALSSCRSITNNPYSVVGTWNFVDVDIDIKSESPTVDKLIRTAFVAYTSLGGDINQLQGTIKFDKNGQCKTQKFTCEYTSYGNTLSLKHKLVNASGVNTKFTIERKYDEMYLTYDAKEIISSLSGNLIDIDIESIEKANIVLVFRKK